MLTLLFCPPIGLAQQAITPSFDVTPPLDASASPDASTVTMATAEQAAVQKSVAKKENQRNGNRKVKGSGLDLLTAADEQAAIQFAEQHLPAMASLVKRLKGRDVVAYRTAINELSTDAKRISRFQERQPDRFQNELNLWKVDTEIRLELARWTVTGSDRQEVSLLRLLQRQQTLRNERLAIERQRLQARIDQIDKRLNLQEGQLKEEVERDMAKLTRKAHSARKKAAKDNFLKGGKKSSSEKKNSKKSNSSPSPEAAFLPPPATQLHVCKMQTCSEQYHVRSQT